MWGGSLADLGPVLVEGAIADVVQAILDRPMLPIEFEQAGRVGLLRREAGDAKDGLALLGVVREVHAHALDARDLLNVGEVEGVGELAGDPDGPGLQASMTLIGGFDYRGKKRAGAGAPDPSRAWAGSL